MEDVRLDLEMQHVFFTTDMFTTKRGTIPTGTWPVFGQASSSTMEVGEYCQALSVSFQLPVASLQYEFDVQTVNRLQTAYPHVQGIGRNATGYFVPTVMYDEIATFFRWYSTSEPTGGYDCMEDYNTGSVYTQVSRACTNTYTRAACETLTFDYVGTISFVRQRSSFLYRDVIAGPVTSLLPSTGLSTMIYGAARDVQPVQLSSHGPVRVQSVACLDIALR